MTLPIRYRCGECCEVYDHEYSARECCMPRVHEVYSCPECSEEHDTETEALNCCPVDDTGVRIISAADLEAQGQMRLELTA